MRFNVDLAVAVLLVLFAVFFTVISYLRLIDIGFFVGALRFSHWLAIIGTIFIAIAVPAFTLLKRSRPSKLKTLYRFHIFGNIVFFTLISMHFAAQISRPLVAYPDLGTGIAMYLAMTLQIATGFTQRFPIKALNLKTNRFIHASLVMVFYFAIIFHTLHGFGIT
jgi:hypothetical protein